MQRTRPVQLHLIAHDIRSKENVGSLFRTCDAFGVSKLWLTGYSPSPPDQKISKVALGAEGVVLFEHIKDIESVLQRLEKEQIFCFALETLTEAEDLADFIPPARMALLLGNEIQGITPSLVARCRGAIKIPQHGIKESLNVAVSAAVASWGILEKR